MRIRPTLAFVLTLAVAVSAFWWSSASPALAQAAQQQLESEPLAIVTANGRHAFTAEIADEPNEQAIGLMHRTEMEANHGMLFDFGEPRIVQMWMKNTPLSLDMLFILPDGTIAHIAERTQPFSLDIVSSGQPVSHVLEIRAGVTRLLGIKPGDRVEHRLFGDG